MVISTQVSLYYVFGNFRGTTWYGSANHTISKQDGRAYSHRMVQPITAAVDMLLDVFKMFVHAQLTFTFHRLISSLFFHISDQI